MKSTYPTLTFLTGVFLVAGVLFVHFYDNLSANASTDAVVTRDPVVASATNTVPATARQSSSASPKPARTPAKTGGSGSSSTPQPPVTSKPSNTSGYANGTYSSTIGYRTPESIEAVKVTLTVSDGTVTDASVANTGSEPTSRRYQYAFANSYRSYVIGKSLASLDLNRVAGSSLTTLAFDAAVNKIRSEASA